MLYMANDMDDLQKAGIIIIAYKGGLFYLLVTGFTQKQDALIAGDKLKSTGFFKARIYNEKK